jgi:hypothetical protein
MTLDEAIQALRGRNEKVPISLRLPTEAEVATAEKELGVGFSFDLRRYLLQASDVVFGALEPVTVADPENHTHLPEVARAAWEEMDLPRDLLPFCEDNGDYYCLNKKGEAAFWSHNDRAVTGKWKNLATWIEEVWIGEIDE